MQVHRLKGLAAGATFAALAALVVHQLAYLAVYPSFVHRSAALGDHGHVSLQWALATPVSVFAVVGFILRQVRGLGVGPPVNTRLISIAAGVLFVVQELIEGAFSSTPLLVSIRNPALIAGVLLAPAVVAVMVRALRTVSNLVVSLASRPTALPARVEQLFVAAAGQSYRQTLCGLAASPRGPPVSFVHV